MLKSYTNICPVFPELSEKQVKQITEKYLENCVAGIISQVLQHGALVDKIFYLSANEMNINCGRVTINGRRERIFQLFQERMPLFKIVEKGNGVTGKLSEVLIMPKYRQEVKELMLVDVETAMAEQKKLGNDYDDLIDIDMENLLNCDKTVWKDHEVMYANIILELARKNKGKLPHFYERSASGRLFAKGINLQNCSRRVRWNALPKPSHMYDLKAGVFAVMKLLCEGLVGQLGYDPVEYSFDKENVIGDYIKNRESIRIEVAEHINDDEKYLKSDILRVKDAFTAVSFGAQQQAGVYYDKAGVMHVKALQSILGTKDKVDAFLGHPKVAAILEVTKEMQEFIYKFYKNGHHKTGDAYDDRYVGFSDKFKFDLHMLSGQKGKFLSHLYQNIESRFLEYMLKRAYEANAEWVLPVHDAIYTDVDLDLANVNYELQKTFIYLEVDHEDLYYAGYKPPTAAERQLQRHKLHIEREERLAREYMSSFAEQTTKDDEHGMKMDSQAADVKLDHFKRMLSPESIDIDMSEEAIAERNRQYFGN